MPEYFFDPAAGATFAGGTFGKSDVARGRTMFLGLNCFAPGQSQAVHAHAGADKFYLVLSGNARIAVGDESREARAGTLAWAPAGVPHGVTEVTEPTVMLVGMSPPPGPRPRSPG